MNSLVLSALAGMSVLALVACTPEEQPVPPPPPSQAQTVQVMLGSEYPDRVFLRLSDMEETGRYLRDSWDLALGWQQGGLAIRLNSAQAMRAWQTGQSELAAVTDTAGADWLWDTPDGDPAGFALRGWSPGQVVVLDRGYDRSGQLKDLVKCRLVSASSSEVLLEWAALESASGEQVSVPLSEQRRFQGLRLDQPAELVEMEPSSDDWDLVFGSYTETFFLPQPFPYLVTGVLSRWGALQTAVDTSIGFCCLTMVDVPSLDFQPAENRIGYDWKTYSFDTNSFAVDTGITYVLQLQSGDLLKLRFLDFYTTEGVKGAPLFQIQALE